jgi:hypothetical protein
MDEPIITTAYEPGEAPVKNAGWWLQLATNAYNKSTSYFDGFIRPMIEDDLRHFNGQHARESKYLTDSYKLKSKTFRPKTRTSIRKHEATAANAFFATTDVVNVEPVDDRNELHRAAASLYKELLQIRLTNTTRKAIPWFQTCIGAYQESMTNGVVAAKIEWEINERKGIDRPRAPLIPAENLRMDPASDWIDPVGSSPYLIYLIPMYIKDVKARMNAGKWQPCSEAQILSAKTNANDSTRQVREGRVDSKDQNGAVTDYTVVWVHEVIVEDEGEDVVFFTLGTEHLLTEPVPLRERYFHGQRPFIIGNCIIEAHKVYPSSFCRLTRSTQTEINDLANQRMENIKLVLNKRYSVKRNKQVDLRSLTRNIAASVTMVNDHDDIKIMDTPDVTASSYNEQDRLNLDYDDLAGGFSGSSVSSNRNLNETVGGMNLLSSSGNQVSDYQLRTFVETFVEPFMRLLIATEREYETDDEVLKMAALKAGIAEISEALLQQDVILSVNVGMNNTNPQVQAERFIYGLTGLAKFKPELIKRLKDEDIVKELFGKLGYRDGGRFFDFQADMSNQDDTKIKQLTIDKLAAEIEQIKATSKVKEVEAMLRRVETLYSSMQTAQVAATVPGAVPIADEISKSAGFLDQNEAPIYPEPGAAALPAAVPAVDLPENTSPMFPAQPAGPGEGMMTGIETPEGDGVVHE